MNQYTPLCSINFFHQYYSNGSCNNLVIGSAPENQPVLLNYHLLYRLTTNGFAIYYDKEVWNRSENISEDLMKSQLNFHFSSENTFFTNFTDLPVNNLNTLNYSNTTASKEGVLQMQVTNKQGVFATISLDLAPMLDAGGKQVNAKDYSIHFSARKTIWRYYVAGAEEQGLNISSDLEFKEGVSSKLPNGTEAMMFESKEPIALRERQNLNIRLDPYQQLLPAPSVQTITASTENSGSFYSNIYFYL